METLPEKVGNTLPALFDLEAFTTDPTQLLEWDTDRIIDAANTVGRDGGGLMTQIRTTAGLVAWVAWCRLPKKTYRPLCAEMAVRLGVDKKTLERWRDAVMEFHGLSAPALAKASTRPLKGKDAGDGASKDILSKTGAISAASRVAPDGVDSDPLDEAGQRLDRGNDPAREEFEDAGNSAPGLTSSNPSSEGGEPRGETHSVPRSKPLSGEGTTPQHTEPVNQPKNDTGSLPSHRQLAARVLNATTEIEPEDAGPKMSADEITALTSWADRAAKAWRKAHGISEPAAKPEPEKRRSGYKVTPADRAKAKLEAAPNPDEPCDHPKTKHKKLGWGTVCECGVRVA